MKKISLSFKSDKTRSKKSENIAVGGSIRISSTSSGGSFGQFSSKVIVKNNFIKNNIQRVSNHIKYIEYRQQGEKAELIDRDKDQVHRYSYQDNINKNIPQVHHKIVISPEDRLSRDQLKELSREIMLKLENHKNQDIMWIAAIHDNEKHTKYPHLHIIASGKDSVLRLERKDLDFMRKETSRYVSLETSIDKTINDKIKELYEKEIAIIDIKTLDKNKVNEIYLKTNNKEIKNMNVHIVIKTAVVFNDKKLNKIGSELFLTKGKNNYMWVENSEINILRKDKIDQIELLALKSEVVFKISETKKSLFSGFKNSKVITIKDEILKQEIIKYNKFEAERKELLSISHTEPDKKILHETAIKSKLIQINEQLNKIKDRYNTLTGVTDDRVNQLIISGKDVEFNKQLEIDISKREKELAMRDMEYSIYEKSYKNELLIRTYYITKGKKLDKAVKEIVDMYKNITGDGKEKNSFTAPLASDISKKLASIDIEKTFRTVLKMKHENNFIKIRSMVLDISETEKFQKGSFQDRKNILSESIKQYLKENKIELAPALTRQIVNENTVIVTLKEIKGDKFLQEKVTGGYYLTLNEAISTSTRANKIKDKDDHDSLNKVKETANRYVENTYFSIKVSSKEISGSNKKTKYLVQIVTKVEHNTGKVVDKIKEGLGENGVKVESNIDNRTHNKVIKITTENKMKLDDIKKIKINMREIFDENNKNRLFKLEKISAMNYLFDAIVDNKRGSTPPIIEKVGADGIKRGSIEDNERLNKLNAQIKKYHEEDPIRIVEHIKNKKLDAQKEITEYINGVKFLHQRDNLNAETAIITEKSINNFENEDRIKEKINENYQNKLKELGIENTNISRENLNKNVSEVKEKIQNREYKIPIEPSKDRQQKIEKGLER